MGGVFSWLSNKKQMFGRRNKLGLNLQQILSSAVWPFKCKIIARLKQFGHAKCSDSRVFSVLYGRDTIKIKGCEQRASITVIMWDQLHFLSPMVFLKRWVDREVEKEKLLKVSALPSGGSNVCSRDEGLFFPPDCSFNDFHVKMWLAQLNLCKIQYAH